jgi:hypothetical protein
VAVPFRVWRLSPKLALQSAPSRIGSDNGVTWRIK